MNLSHCSTCAHYVSGLPPGTGFCGSTDAWQAAAVVSVHDRFGCVYHTERKQVLIPEDKLIEPEVEEWRRN